MRKFLTFKFSFFLILAMTSVAVAVEKPTPDVLKGGEIISAEEAKAIFDKKAATFFDVRNFINYGRGHIPDAFLLPYIGELEKSIDFDPPESGLDISRLPSNKGENIVFYSHGTTGWKSYMAAVLAIKAGYQNVMWLREGYSEWERKGYPVLRGK